VASECMTIRFPSGDWEYAMTERVPDVGDSLGRAGKTWIVTGGDGSEGQPPAIVMALRPELLKFPSR
jgi:hypothetical protein